MITIEKGIPMPDTKRHAKYPWDQLEVGDSFFIPNNLSNFYYINARLAPKRFIFKQVEEKGVRGTRVWRTHDQKEPDFDSGPPQKLPPLPTTTITVPVIKRSKK